MCQTSWFFKDHGHGTELLGLRPWVCMHLLVIYELLCQEASQPQHGPWSKAWSLGPPTGRWSPGSRASLGRKDGPSKKDFRISIWRAARDAGDRGLSIAGLFSKFGQGLRKLWLFWCTHPGSGPIAKNLLLAPTCSSGTTASFFERQPHNWWEGTMSHRLKGLAFHPRWLPM